MSDNRAGFHRTVCRVLEQGISNRDWYLRVEVDTAWDRSATPLDLDATIAEVGRWLDALDPDQALGGIARVWSPGPGAARVSLTARRKPPEARRTPLLVAYPSAASDHWERS